MTDPAGDWSATYCALGYAWCRPCAEWHRPPECWIDSGGRSRLDLMIMSERNDPTMTHDDQPDELPAGDSYDCGHGAYCVQCPPGDYANAAAAAEQALAEQRGDTPPADPDRPCYHPEFEIVALVARVGEDDKNNLMPGMPTAFVAEITIKCGPCGERMKFQGVPAGLSFDAPAVSVDGFELRAPIQPETLPPRRQRLSGRAIDGYTVRRRAGDSPLGLPDDGGRQ